eukprot:COSAG04_NODE_5591_length_1557_cov_1.148834_2_plen_245_part_00
MFPNLALVHRALHPSVVAADPRSFGLAEDLSPDSMETEAERAGVRALLSFLGAALGLEPAPEQARAHLTSVWALALEPGAVAPSVCDVSAAVLAYRGEPWRRAEQALRAEQHESLATDGVARAEEQRLSRQEQLRRQPSSGDAVGGEPTSPAGGSLDVPPDLPPSPPTRLPAAGDASGNRFGASGTVELVEDHSSFEEDGELWVWRRYRDGATGRLFYVNSKTGEKQWRKPSRTVRSIRAQPNA